MKWRTLPNTHHSSDMNPRTLIMEDIEAGKVIGWVEPEYAAMVAAAPDLVEALELILPLARAAYIGSTPEDGNYRGAKKTRDKWITIAEAALKKAGA